MELQVRGCHTSCRTGPWPKPNLRAGGWLQGQGLPGLAELYEEMVFNGPVLSLV